MVQEKTPVQEAAPFSGAYGRYDSLKGKRVLVTGGSAGIGRAAALAFGANGAQVAIMGRRKERLDPVVAQLKGGLAVVGDLAVPEDCTRAVEETIAAFGGLDILINNGAVSTDQMNAHALEPQGYEAAYRLHVSSLMQLVKAAEGELIKNRGNIVNVSSAAAVSTPDNPTMMGYFVAKAAQQKLTEGQARHYAKYGVRVNSALPAWVRTEATDHLAAAFGKPVDEVIKAAGSIHALGRISYPDEQAAGILFLASDAASFITGTELLIDGGAGLMGKTFPTF